jgi:hypothetical protein
VCSDVNSYLRRGRFCKVPPWHTVKPLYLTGATKLGDDRYDVGHNLEGDFLGGKVDLHFRFTLRDGKIARLVVDE